MDEAFDVWKRFKSPYDYAMDFPQWWRAEFDALVAKDYNHPNVIMYSLGNQIAEVGDPFGAVLAREMAEHVRAQDPTQLVTNGVNAALAVLDELPGAPATGGGGLNEMLSDDMGDSMNRLGSSESATVRIAESSSVLDVLGLNYAEGRSGPDAQTVLAPRARRVGDLRPSDRSAVADGSGASARHRRLRLDRLGLP